MQSIKSNVIFLTSERQMEVLWSRHWGIFDWIKFFSQKTNVNIVTSILGSITTIFDFRKVMKLIQFNYWILRMIWMIMKNII